MTEEEVRQVAIEEPVKKTKKQAAKKEKAEGAVEVKEEVKLDSNELEEKKKKLIDKAKALAEKMISLKHLKSDINTEIMGKTSKEIEELRKIKAENMLVPLEDYVKSGIYLGTKVITPDMQPYVFKRRSDGLAIINTKLADEKIRAAANLLSEYAPSNIVVTCKREAGWKALEEFSKLTGISVFTKKYPAGIITNTKLPEFFEPELAVIVDPWIDKNLLADSTLINIPIISLCDTNNLTSNIDLIVPCNNKSNKSIGLVFWILAREYIKARKIDAKMPELKEFTGEKE